VVRWFVHIRDGALQPGMGAKLRPAEEGCLVVAAVAAVGGRPATAQSPNTAALHRPPPLLPQRCHAPGRGSEQLCCQAAEAARQPPGSR
jgi:hypothetical protein